MTLESKIAALAERAEAALSSAENQSAAEKACNPNPRAFVFRKIRESAELYRRAYRAERLLREAESMSMNCWSLCTDDSAPGEGEPDYRCKTCVRRESLRAQAAALVEES